MKRLLPAVFLTLLLLTGINISRAQDNYNCSTIITIWEWWEFAPGIGAYVPHEYEVWHPCDTLPQPEAPPEV